MASTGLFLFMCACGCFFLLAAAAGLAYCFLNHLWLPFGLILAATLAISWFGRNLANRRPGQKPKP